jgi:hypothetical protein
VRKVAVAVVLLTLGSVGLGQAGGGFGDFVIDPTSGTAGQQIQITASDEAPVCSDLTAAGPSIRINGTFLADVVVTLWNPGKTMMLDQEEQAVNIGDSWSVILTMPSGQPAGSYPVSATCTNGETTLGDYNDQIFVLRAPSGSRKAKAVQAEVSLTG